MARAGARWKEGDYIADKRDRKRKGILDVGDSVFEGRQSIIVVG